MIFSSSDIRKLPKALRHILDDRGYLTDQQKQDFLNIDYEKTNYDPQLLPDMSVAVERLKNALDKNQQVTIYSDYDVDGVTGCVVLMDALSRFGFRVNYYVPDRFKEGYGLNKDALKKLKERGTDLVVTVDNGIVSFDEVAFANSIGLDVIITDHHSPRAELPPAIAVVNPKIALRDYPEEYGANFVAHNKSFGGYPFLDLCGCGVAFKLVQALQQKLPDKLPKGHEKWLLDLVAMATVSDVVNLVDENRALVYWGLKVIAKGRRPGLKALTLVSGNDPENLNSQAIGFGLGPRLNAAGRLLSARLSIELLLSKDNEKALQLAKQLNDLNTERRSLQASIYQQALEKINPADPVAIARGQDWHEGVIGIVASKVMESVGKPTFIFTNTEDPAMVKASGRSFGQFSIASAIASTSQYLSKGGGHAFAGGVSVATKNFNNWQLAINDYYRSLGLSDQEKYLYPKPDIIIDNLAEASEELVSDLRLLEPYGAGNPLPIFLLKNVIVVKRQLMGIEKNHVRYTFIDDHGNKIDCVAFNAADSFTIDVDKSADSVVVRVDALVELSLNEWQGNISVQGKLLKLDRK